MFIEHQPCQLYYHQKEWETETQWTFFDWNPAPPAHHQATNKTVLLSHVIYRFINKQHSIVWLSGSPCRDLRISVKSSKCVSKLNHFDGLFRNTCQALVIPGNMKVFLLSRWPSLALLGLCRRIKSKCYYCFYVALRLISDSTMTPRGHLSSGGKKSVFSLKYYDSFFSTIPGLILYNKHLVC